MHSMSPRQCILGHDRRFGNWKLASVASETKVTLKASDDVDRLMRRVPDTMSGHRGGLFLVENKQEQILSRHGGVGMTSSVLFH